MARPSDLTPQIQAAIVDSICKSVPPESAARAAGVSPRTYYRWTAQGRADDEADRDTPFRQFWQAVEEALAVAEAALLETVRVASADEWRAATWLLERRFSRRYGEHHKAAAQQEEYLRAKLESVRARLGEETLARVLEAIAESSEPTPPGAPKPTANGAAH